MRPAAFDHPKFIASNVRKLVVCERRLDGAAMDTKDLLDEIARTLGVPVATFIDGSPTDLEQLIRFWVAIWSPTDRRKTVSR